MYSPPDAETDGLLRRLAHDIRHRLQDNLIGMYLFGSLVTGDFNRERSDLDLLAVVSTDIDEQAVEGLREMHARLVEEYPAWRDRVEVNYVSVTALATFRTRPGRMARISPGEPLHLTEAGRHYLLNWYVVRHGGVALFGPPPQQLIPEISQVEFVEAIREHARNWKEWVADMRHPGGQVYAVLTLCRALHGATYGEQASKKQAARSVQLWLPRWSALIEWALCSWSEDGAQTADHDRFPEVVRFVEDVRARILGAAEKDRDQ